MTDDLRSRVESALGAGYRIVEELGKGGVSRVLLAEEPGTGARVVVKVLPPELAADLSADRFRREISLMAKLVHPNIVPILRASDTGDAGLLYYLMPYEAGDTIRSLMARERQLSIELVRQVGRELALALDFAHRLDVVHRDIKPENVLLVDGRAMVIDFGVARAVSSASNERMTATGLTVGTPHYMSPEQASGDRELDGRSDIYSLGCLLFEMLTGEVPHRAPTVQMTLSRRLSEPAPDVATLRPSVAADLRQVLHRALAPAPRERYRTAGEMAIALGASPPAPELAHRGIRRRALDALLRRRRIR